jgi:hypothetical protein
MVDLDLFLQRERLITQPLAWLDEKGRSMFGGKLLPPN